MLAVAIIGVPTPLLAMHWYSTLLFAVQGLVIFTMISSEAVVGTSELPTLFHFILGFGFPKAAHVKFKLLPSRTVFTSGETVTCGASTAVTMTLAFSPAPTLLNGTHVYKPSDTTVTLKIPELLVSMRLPLKYK